MMANHVDCEVGCALAASGLLTRTELAELSEHAAHCVLCHDRLVEFRRAGIQLFLVRALNNSDERLPKGMQRRFVARAIREGIPLRSGSQGVRFSALGAVTVLLVVLLLAVATLNNGSLPGSAGDTGLADTSHRPVAIDKAMTTTQEIPAHAVIGRRVPRRSHAAAIRRPPSAPRFIPKLTFATSSEIIRHNAPHLLPGCEQCTFVPLSFQSRFVFAPPAAQSFHGGLDPDTLRTGLKPDFKANVTHLVWNVVPQ
jgi:hypothetical protein